MAEHPRMPLVLAATKVAVEQAGRLGVEGVLENRIGEALRAGRVFGPRRAADAGRFVDIGDGVRVSVRGVRSQSGRRAWLPVRVERAPRGRPAR